MSEQTRYRTVADSSSESEGGYFAYVRRLLSYVNPLSYFSGGASSSPGQDAQRGIWEYGEFKVQTTQLMPSVIFF